jgi:hypothetical protein
MSAHASTLALLAPAVTSMIPKVPPAIAPAAVNGSYWSRKCSCCHVYILLVIMNTVSRPSTILGQHSINLLYSNEIVH